MHVRDVKIVADDVMRAQPRRRPSLKHTLVQKRPVPDPITFRLFLQSLEVRHERRRVRFPQRIVR